MKKVIITCLINLCFLADAYLTMAQTGQWEYTGGPCYSGEVHDIVYDPANPDVIYITLYDRFTYDYPDSSGVYKSNDAGLTWDHVLSEALPFDLAIIPGDPQYVFAGTWRSMDSGENWENMTDLPYDVSELVIHPLQSNTIYAGTHIHGVFRSENNGDSWQQFADLQGDIESIVIHPADADTIFAGSDEEGIYYTYDGGASWNNIPLNVVHLAFDTVNPGIMFAVTSDSLVVKSTDFFTTWDVFDLNGIVALAIHPTNSQTIFAGGEGIYHSFNGGETWEQVDGVLTGFSRKVKSISVLPDQTVFLGTDVTLFHKMSASEEWEPRSPCVATSRVRYFDIVGETVYATTLFGLVYYQDENWYINGFRNLMNWAAQKIYVNPNTPNLMIAKLNHSGQFQLLYRSDDRGNTWHEIDVINQAQEITIPVAIAPSDPNVVYASHFRSTNSGITWTLMNGIIQTAYIIDIAVHPWDSQTVYALLSTSDSGLYKTIDGGSTWTNLELSDENTHLRIFFDPSDGNTLYITGDGGILKTTNGGEDWTSINNGLPDLDIHGLSIHPNFTNRLYVGLELNNGVYYSQNGGEQWNNFTTLPDYDLGYVQTIMNSSYLYAGFVANDLGVYRYQLPQDTAFVETDPLMTQTRFFFNNFPNPFSENTNIQFSLPNSCRTVITIYNLVGERVTTLHDGILQSGDHSLTWNGKNQKTQQLASGIYLCQVKADNLVKHRRLVYIH